jgi:hypothetical protein
MCDQQHELPYWTDSELPCRRHHVHELPDWTVSDVMEWIPSVNRADFVLPTEILYCEYGDMSLCWVDMTGNTTPRRKPFLRISGIIQFYRLVPDLQYL